MRRYSKYIRRYKDYKIGPLLDSYNKYDRNSLPCKLTFSEAKLRRIQRKRREKLEATRIVAS